MSFLILNALQLSSKDSNGSTNSDDFLSLFLFFFFWKEIL
ncbi:hypothetical protein PanWU01x14_042900 [Parasponia andersonii]|uniref:Uncharacterized protein n=1 Tax=Parasponia andersonii TaxID=3476 RepID=A0A2P5DPU9_PARAD|nr:hypothetical protein PanWU01x14_042900 [Parasponia andersonii]